MDYGRGIGQPLSQNDLRSIGKSSSLVDENVLENEERDMGVKNNGVVSSEGLVEASKEFINEETNEMRGVGETLDQVDQGSSGSLDNSVDGFAVETIIVINTQEAACVDGSNGVIRSERQWTRFK